MLIFSALTPVMSSLGRNRHYFLKNKTFQKIQKQNHKKIMTPTPEMDATRIPWVPVFQKFRLGLAELELVAGHLEVASLVAANALRFDARLREDLPLFVLKCQ
jgi:hypothetical protein